MDADMQSRLRAFVATIPPLTYAAHKGSAGRIGVIGGSQEYTGAPYFSAISSMRAGGDLAHVFCPEAAAPVIKAYSPELIVHPLLSGNTSESCAAILPWFPRLHTLVIGPGLGRDPAVLATVSHLVHEARKEGKVMVIDADGLFLVNSEPEIVEGYRNVILTPNEVEFGRLYQKMFGTALPAEMPKMPEEQTKLLAARMGYLTIVRKGKKDIISDGTQVLMCDESGCPRRCGGQGDLLSGIIGLFSHWAKQSIKHAEDPLLTAAYGGCFLIKKCAEQAFSKHKRSMLASDMVEEIGAVFQTMLEPQNTSV